MGHGDSHHHDWSYDGECGKLAEFVRIAKIKNKINQNFERTGKMGRDVGDRPGKTSEPDQYRNSEG